VIALLTAALPYLVQGGIALAGYLAGRWHAARIAKKAK
jgi:hypothetical protein